MFTQRSWSHIYFGKFLHFCGRGNELREPLFVKYGNARNCVSNFNYSAKSLLSWAFHNGGCCHPLIDSRFLVLSSVWQICSSLLLSHSQWYSSSSLCRSQCVHRWPWWIVAASPTLHARGYCFAQGWKLCHVFQILEIWLFSLPFGLKNFRWPKLPTWLVCPLFRNEKLKL